MYTSVCMICMILTGLLWSRVMIAARSVRMRVLHKPLADLSIGCFKISTSDVRASDTVPLIDDQAKGWRPWPDDWDNDFWMMNYCMVLVVHFFCPRNSFADSYSSMFHFESLSADSLFFPKLPPELHFAPDFWQFSPIEMVTLRSSLSMENRINPILHSSSLLFFKCTTKTFYLFSSFSWFYFCLSRPFGFST